MNRKEKLKNGILKCNKHSANNEGKRKSTRGNFNCDIWKENGENLNKKHYQWLTSDTVRHTIANEGIRKRKIPASLHKKPSEISTIEIPHPGMSYNPSYEDHQKLLHTIAKEEINSMKIEAHLDRVTNGMFKKVSVETQEKVWMKESSEGLPLNTNDKEKQSEEENDNDDDPNRISINPPAKNKKKTLVDRRKQREQKKLAFEMKNKKIEKKKLGDVYKLRIFEEKINKNEKRQKILRDKREKIKAIKSLEPKVLSKTKFEPAELDFKMGEELSGNLRNAAPTGNLLKDRYKSLQQRNIVAPSKRVLKLNKAKVKKYVKADHKITMPPKLM
ncbi:hypothetical protein PV327_000862 [Microctonus hyperodae]|uniref:Ribosome biogenesis protein NOP53 n=1 Tax=Microctonus hyperodae TaxID=165561 RepID=A0AA39G876_MICHY|nr:hypothetical protein PV327_000862 [Microctonus hyperodae]